MKIKVLACGDEVIKKEILRRWLRIEISKATQNIEIKAIDWPFSGYQKGEIKGIIKEFSGSPEKLEGLVDEDTDVLVVHMAPVTKEVMDASKKLKVVGCTRGGPVNIDVPAATKRGIPVINAPGRNAEAVADYTIGLILSLSRNITKAHYMLKNGRWMDDFYYYENCGPELSGKTIGIVGFGHIGRLLAKRALAFNIKILAHDPFVAGELIEQYGGQSVDLETLLKNSDFVTLHVRLTPKTEKMIGERELSLMKKTAYFINTARGGLVDENALIKALKERWVTGAALDVFEKEPIEPKNPLLTLDNVVITPHIAGASKQLVERTSKMVAEDIKSVLTGELPKNCVNPEVLTH